MKDKNDYQFNEEGFFWTILSVFVVLFLIVIFLGIVQWVFSLFGFSPIDWVRDAIALAPAGVLLLM